MTCFVTVPRVAGSVDSLARLCSVVVARLSVASLILAACFPRISRRFIPVEIRSSV